MSTLQSPRGRQGPGSCLGRLWGTLRARLLDQPRTSLAASCLQVSAPMPGTWVILPLWVGRGGCGAWARCPHFPVLLFQNGFDYLLTYSDNPQTVFPRYCVSWMVSSGEWVCTGPGAWVEGHFVFLELFNGSKKVSACPTRALWEC